MWESDTDVVSERAHTSLLTYNTKTHIHLTRSLVPFLEFAA